MIVVGSPNSSNSQRLREVAERSGCAKARLVLRAADIDWSIFGDIRSLAITAGASAPEVLVEVIVEQAASLRSPPQSVEQLLDILRENGLARAVARVRVMSGPQ